MAPRLFAIIGQFGEFRRQFAAQQTVKPGPGPGIGLAGALERGGEQIKKNPPPVSRTDGGQIDHGEVENRLPYRFRLTILTPPKIATASTARTIELGSGVEATTMSGNAPVRFNKSWSGVSIGKSMAGSA